MALPFGTSDQFSQLLQRQLAAGALDTGPVGHWSQGLNRMAQALLLGLERNKEESDHKDIAKFLMDQGSAGMATTSAPTSSPRAGATVADSGSPVHYVAPDKPSPLDAEVMTPQELGAGVASYVPDKYKSIVGKAEIDQDLPKDLLSKMLRQESGFNPNAVSGQGAQGMAQLMPKTAESLGVTNSFDPNQAIPAGAQYLRQGLNAYAGDPRMAAAYYHGGPNQSQWGPKTAQYAQAVGGSQAPQSDPINRMLSSDSRAIRNMGMGLRMQQIQQQMTPKDPNYGVIGEDQYGAKTYGWINPRAQSVRPVSTPGASQGQSNIPAPPPGVNPKVWRDEMTKRAMGETLPPEVGGRLGMMDAAVKDLPKAREVFAKQWGAAGVGQEAAARMGWGSLAGEIGQARRTVRLAIESALRVMTGAAAPESEVKRYEDMFMPHSGDDAASAKQKLDALEAFMGNAKKNIMQGRTLPDQGGWTDVAPGIRIRPKQ